MRCYGLVSPELTDYLELVHQLVQALALLLGIEVRVRLAGRLDALVPAEVLGSRRSRSSTSPIIPRRAPL